jgi:hypothetical protein
MESNKLSSEPLQLEEFLDTARKALRTTSASKHGVDAAFNSSMCSVRPILDAATTTVSLERADAYLLSLRSLPAR